MQNNLLFFVFFLPNSYIQYLNARQNKVNFVWVNLKFSNYVFGNVINMTVKNVAEGVLQN